MDYMNYNNAHYNNMYQPTMGYMYQQPVAYQSLSIYDKCRMFFSSNAFLAATILYTIAVVTNFAFNIYFMLSGNGIFASRYTSRSSYWPNLFYYGNTLAYMLPELLIIIFLFACRSAAIRNTLSWNHVRRISGTVMSHVVMVIVYAVLFGVGSAWAMIAYATNQSYMSYHGYSSFYSALHLLFGTFIAVLFYIIIITCIFAAVLLLIFALCGLNGIRKFAKSVYQSMQTGNEYIIKRGAAKGWLITLGVLALIYSFAGMSFIFYGQMINVVHLPIFILRGVAYIIFGVQIGKHFKPAPVWRQTY